MGRKAKTRDQVLDDVLSEFPDAPTLTLAKKVYGEWPEHFKSVEVARSAIRYRRGNIGSANRKLPGSKKHKRGNGDAGYEITGAGGTAMGNTGSGNGSNNTFP